jgi:hypothetical protein
MLICFNLMISKYNKDYNVFIKCKYNKISNEIVKLIKNNKVDMTLTVSV